MTGTPVPEAPAPWDVQLTKSISGHTTDETVDHYSSINPNEQRESIKNGRVAQP